MNKSIVFLCFSVWALSVHAMEEKKPASWEIINPLVEPITMHIREETGEPLKPNEVAELGVENTFDIPSQSKVSFTINIDDNRTKKAKLWLKNKLFAKLAVEIGHSSCYPQWNLGELLGKEPLFAFLEADTTLTQSAKQSIIIVEPKNRYQKYNEVKKRLGLGTPAQQ